MGETSDGDLHLIRHIHIKNVAVDFNRAMKYLNKLRPTTRKSTSSS